MKQRLPQILLIIQLITIIPLTHAAASSSSSASSSSVSSAPTLPNRTEELKNILRTFRTTDAALRSPFVKEQLERITEILPGCTYPKIRSIKNKVTGAHLLHAAAIHNNASLITQLLALKAKGNVRLNNWELGHQEDKISNVTPLHIAAFFSYTECVAALLKQPTVRRNAQDSNGNTPLHTVGRSRATHVTPSGAFATAETARLLMEAGSCLYKRNNNGHRPQEVTQVWSPAIFAMKTFEKEKNCQCKAKKKHRTSSSGGKIPLAIGAASSSSAK